MTFYDFNRQSDRPTLLAELGLQRSAAGAVLDGELQVGCRGDGRQNRPHHPCSEWQALEKVAGHDGCFHFQ
jgi:hypothetical protein